MCITLKVNVCKDFNLQKHTMKTSDMVDRMDILKYAKGVKTGRAP